MVSYSFDANRNFTVTLDNGQVWRQLSGDSGRRLLAQSLLATTW